MNDKKETGAEKVAGILNKERIFLPFFLYLQGGAS